MANAATLSRTVTCSNVVALMELAGASSGAPSVQISYKVAQWHELGLGLLDAL